MSDFTSNSTASFVEIESMLKELNRQLEREKSLKNKLLLENAIGSLRSYSERIRQ